MFGKKKKQPGIGGSQPSDRQPRIETDPNDFSRQTPAWRFGLLQLQGPWNWSEVEAATMHWIREKFCSLERMSWTDIERGGSHNVEQYRIARDARNRLREIGMEDVEHVFSLRLGGQERVWGIRVLNVLRILWWDPNHEICPSYKKRT